MGSSYVPVTKFLPAGWRTIRAGTAARFKTLHGWLAIICNVSSDAAQFDLHAAIRYDAVQLMKAALMASKDFEYVGSLAAPAYFFAPADGNYMGANFSSANEAQLDAFKAYLEGCLAPAMSGLASPVQLSQAYLRDPHFVEPLSLAYQYVVPICLRLSGFEEVARTFVLEADERARALNASESIEPYPLFARNFLARH
jgi:hypothetical protein